MSLSQLQQLHGQVMRSASCNTYPPPQNRDNGRREGKEGGWEGRRKGDSTYNTDGIFRHHLLQIHGAGLNRVVDRLRVGTQPKSMLARCRRASRRDPNQATLKLSRLGLGLATGGGGGQGGSGRMGVRHVRVGRSGGAGAVLAVQVRLEWVSSAAKGRGERQIRQAEGAQIARSLQHPARGMRVSPQHTHTHTHTHSYI